MFESNEVLQARCRPNTHSAHEFEPGSPKSGSNYEERWIIKDIDVQIHGKIPLLNNPYDSNYLNKFRIVKHQ